jgi:hypothetical protein
MMEPDYGAVLEQAIGKGDRPTTAALVLALLQAEKANRGRSFGAESLMGDWRLFFSSRGKVKLGDKGLRGFYLPSWLPAQIEFGSNDRDEAPLEVTNRVMVGLINLKLTGPARFSEKKNLLAFDFTRLEVKVLGQVIYKGKFPSPRKDQVFMDIPVGKLPFFAFFEVSDRLIAARGRGGGLAIWVK